MVMIATFSVFWALFKYGGPQYTEWAQGQISKLKGILNAAKEDHKSAVRKRLDNVKQLSSVVDVTKQLFEVSKVCHRNRHLTSSFDAISHFSQETAHLEAQAFELEQKTALAAEAKSVLESWVRYEGQVKQRQQKELAESIIGKVTKELENPRTLQQILQQSVADVESKSNLFGESIDLIASC